MCQRGDGRDLELSTVEPGSSTQATVFSPFQSGVLSMLPACGAWCYVVKRRITLLGATELGG